jgi:hypothetical protein
VSFYAASLITRDSDNTTFEVLGEALHEGLPKVFIRKCGSIGWHRLAHLDLVANFTAFPDQAAMAGVPDAGAQLRLIPLPDLSDLMARATAVRWNRDLIETARSREINAPSHRIVRERDVGIADVAPITPSACRWCDLDERDHGTRFAYLVGMHDYAAPTDLMRLSRMRGRRAARTQEK